MILRGGGGVLIGGAGLGYGGYGGYSDYGDSDYGSRAMAYDVPVQVPVPVPVPVPAAPALIAAPVPAAPSRDEILAALTGTWRGDGGGTRRPSHPRGPGRKPGSSAYTRKCVAHLLTLVPCSV